MTLETALITGISAQTGLLVFFFKWYHAKALKTEKRLLDCEQDRKRIEHVNELLFILIAGIEKDTVESVKARAEEIYQESQDASS